MAFESAASWLGTTVPSRPLTEVPVLIVAQGVAAQVPLTGTVATPGMTSSANVFPTRSTTATTACVPELVAAASAWLTTCCTSASDKA